MKEDLANMVTIEWDHSGRQMAALSLTLQVNKILTDNSKLPVFQAGDKKNALLNELEQLFKGNLYFVSFSSSEVLS